MIKRLSALALLVILTLTFVGCAKETNSDPYVIVENNDPFYDEMIEKQNVRPVAVMIDNDVDAARPQIGLESAYMVYEIVVEGRATRFMALFKDYDLEKIGPIRSSRHYFLDYALEHDAIYTHAGWSPKAAKDIKSLGVNNVNGVAGDSDIYWRDNTYDKTWHNLYTSLLNVSERADSKEYRRTTDNAIPDYNKNDEVPNGTDVLEISIPYANFYKVTYKYDETTKRFIRYVNGKTHDSQTGETLSAKNIIMYTVKNVNLPDTEDKGRQDLENIGSGTGYYFSNGKMVEIKWEKTARDAKTKYTLADGTPLKLNPGNTFIQIVPTYVGTEVTHSEPISQPMQPAE